MQNDQCWYKDVIIYEAHVRSFFDCNDDGVGDFEGFTQKLDYLQDLGISAIWLLPFYPSPLRDDGYDISAYRGINKQYGTIRDFRRFVKEAHRRGMAVITELVLNHTSDQHRWFQAARQAPPGSPKRNFYVWSDTDQKYSQARIIFPDSEKSNWTWDPMAKAYYWHRFFYHQPDLNYDNPEVLKEMISVLRFWLDFEVDGFRLDAVPYLVEREGTNCENLPETHEILKKIREEMDAHYQYKMILAEANQWPSDVRPYFGDGDECHMAFHFPLMPRIFMALRQEDRHPITEILRQTPEIPHICQWALFLRNHDELTLEMVTDEERDYMYNAYAADPRMRINFGIRRRLAPLMDNSRRRMELLNSLLFSFCGTPIIYYGDEIGMGDNIYIGDRNGVRTPMQWSSDRNAGFSRADFAKLYLPPIMDPVYGYQAVNVEAQLRDPSSLLNWMRRIISLRNRFRKLFGRGSFEFLYPENRKILAYIRKYQNDTILCIANLSRFVQPVELNLLEFEGLIPIEMIGGTEFPKVRKEPYFLTLGPHSFYWFHLVRETEPIAIRKARITLEEIQSIPLMVLKGKWDTLTRVDSIRKLEKFVFPKYLERQSWFGDRNNGIRSVRVLDFIPMPFERVYSVFFFVRVHFWKEPGKTYIVPIVIVTGEEAEILWQTSTDCILARIKSEGKDGVLLDAMTDDIFCRNLLSFLDQQGSIAARGSTLKAMSISRLPEQPVANWKVRRIGDRRKNSCVVYNEQWILKLFRRLEKGINPDCEMLQFLSRNRGFRNVPLLMGALEYQSQNGTLSMVAVLEEMVPNQGDAWTYTQNELLGFMDRVRGQAVPELPSVTNVLEISPPSAVVDAIGLYLRDAEILGKRTAELHLTLASGGEKEQAFRPEEIKQGDLKKLSELFREQGERVLRTLRDRVKGIRSDAKQDAEAILAEAKHILNHFRKLSSLDMTLQKIRIHGNYHLGEVLRVEKDFVILDFEGETSFPLQERRAKQFAFKDAASMLYSFSYAAYTGLMQNREESWSLKPWIQWWYLAVSNAFLNSYFLIAGKAGFVPQKQREIQLLLTSFLLDKALMELEYELKHRPDRVRISVAGILDLLKMI